MSVIVTLKVKGDTSKFRQALKDRPDEFRQFAERAKIVGATHHRFGVGDGFVLMVDEWDSEAAFKNFFSASGLQEFIGSLGAAPEPPEMTFAESVSSPDQF